MNAIDLINKAVSKSAINVKGDDYKAIMGDEDFVPESVIVQSSDYNCGAVSNELEFARTVANSLTVSLTIGDAENEDLTSLVQSFINLSRLSTTEPDTGYRARFKVLAVQESFPHRTTPGAIRSALSYIIDKDNISVIEYFDTQYYYFELRLIGSFVRKAGVSAFLDFDFLDNTYLGGIGVGIPIPYINALVERVKAVGVDFDILVTDSNSFTKSSDAEITV